MRPLSRALPAWGRVLLTTIVATSLLGGLSLPVLLFEYGFADDFIAWMWYTSERFVAMDSMFARHGRYLLGFLVDGVYGTWREFGELWKVRLLSIVGWGVAATVIFHGVLPKNWSGRRRAVHTAATVLTPAVGVTIAYSVCFAYGWGSALALGAGILAVRCAAAESGQWRWVQGILAVTGVSLAFMIYQPVAFFFLFPMLVHAEGLPGKRFWRDRWVRAAIVFVLGAVLYGAVYLSVQAGFAADDAGAQRGTLGELSFDRLVHLIAFLWTALQSWGALLPVGWGLLSGGITLLLVLVGAWRGPGWGLTAVTLAAALALPLLVPEVVFFSRLLVVVYAVFAFLALEGARFLWHRVPALAAVGGSLLAGAYVSVLAVLFAGSLYWGFVRPGVAELAWGREQAAALEAPPAQLLYVMPDCGEAVAWPGRWLSEYGRTATCVTPNARPFVTLVFWERFAEELSLPSRSFPRPWLNCVYTYEFEQMDAAGLVGPETVVWRGDGFAAAYRAPN